MAKTVAVIMAAGAGERFAGQGPKILFPLLGIPTLVWSARRFARHPAVAAWLAQHQTPAGLILESTFTSIPDIGAEAYPFLPVRFMSRYHYNTVDYVGRVRCPLLIVHSRDDEMIPVAHGRRLFDAAKEPKEFLEIQGSHNDGFLMSGNLYRQGLGGFLGKYLKD